MNSTVLTDPQTAEKFGDNARILVVDDEPDVADSLQLYLSKRTGSQIQIANSGEEALEAMESALYSPQGAFDLIILDMAMPPGMGGREVLGWIRSHPRLLYTRVIILTASPLARVRIEALSAGADDYISKPYHQPELLARVRTMLRSHQLEKQLQQQSEQLSALNQVNLAMTALRDTSAVFDAAVRGARHILGADIAAIFLQQKGTERLVCRQIISPYIDPPKYNPIPIGKGLIGNAYAQQMPDVSNYPDTHAAFDLRYDAPPHISLHNILVTPFKIRNHSVGILVAANKSNGDFNDVDRSLFGSLTNTVGRVIENAWLFQGLKRRQGQILESRNRLQAVIDGILHPIYTVNSAYKVVAVNEAKAQTFNGNKDEIVGSKCFNIFYNRSEPCDHCAVANTLRHQEANRWSVRWMDDDHLPREWAVIAYPLPSENTEQGQAVVVWEDVTEARRLEYHLLQAGKLAAIGQLAAGVAHEINNPMAVINASAAMLKLEITEDEDNIELVDMIEQAGERAAKVVRNLLDFARQEEYDFESVDVNKSIREALHLVIYQLNSSQIEVQEDLSGSLPAIYASSEHLKTVWINLIINARDALQECEGKHILEISTRYQADEGFVRVVVRDNGKGMPKSRIGHIFEPFFTTKDPGKGTGLGLSTSHRIIEQHAGDIEVVSSPGEGAMFVVRLPASCE